MKAQKTEWNYMTLEGVRNMQGRNLNEGRISLFCFSETSWQNWNGRFDRLIPGPHPGVISHFSH
jgi:hypothetical protein